jgi:hypothetical protein
MRSSSGRGFAEAEMLTHVFVIVMSAFRASWARVDESYKHGNMEGAHGGS